MADKDFYEILGVAKNAGEDEIKKSVYYIFHLAKKVQDTKLAEKEIKIK